MDSYRSANFDLRSKGGIPDFAAWTASRNCASTVDRRYRCFDLSSAFPAHPRESTIDADDWKCVTCAASTFAIANIATSVEN
jgi:hypothetical protein